MQFTLTIELGSTLHTEVEPHPQDVAYVMLWAFLEGYYRDIFTKAEVQP